MKSSFFFSTLTFVGLLMLVACGDPTPSELQAYHVSCPDSVYVYHLQQDGTEYLCKKTFYAYDANGLVLSEITYAAYDEAHMKPSSKIEYSYDSNHNIQRILKYLYNEKKQEWYVLRQRVYTYEADKLATILLYAELIADLDGPLYKKGILSWSDDTHAEMLVYRNLVNNSDSEQWMLCEKSETVYNTRGKLENEKYYFDYKQDSTYTSMMETKYTYDHYGNMSSCEQLNNTIVGKEETYTYSYDDEGNIQVKWTASSLSHENTKFIYYY